VVDEKNMTTNSSIFNLSSTPHNSTNQGNHNTNQENLTNQSNRDNCGNFKNNLGNTQTKNTSKSFFFQIGIVLNLCSSLLSILSKRFWIKNSPPYHLKGIMSHESNHHHGMSRINVITIDARDIGK
jgi:hypothetical protein